MTDNSNNWHGSRAAGSTAGMAAHPASHADDSDLSWTPSTPSPDLTPARAHPATMSGHTMSFSPSDYTLLGVVLQPGEELPSVPPDRPAIFQPEVMRTLDTEWWAGLDGGGTRGEGALPGSVTAPAPGKPSSSHGSIVVAGPADAERVTSPDPHDRGAVRSARHSARQRRTGTKGEGECCRQDAVEGSTTLTKYIQAELLGGMLNSGMFRALVLFVIVLNSALVGLQTNEELERHYAALFIVLDFIFLAFFAVEIILKWLADFAGFWRVGWNVFDFLIVTISMAGQGLSFMSSGRVLRILRVLRAFRTIKSIRMVRGLQMIVNTVFRSLPDMAYIFLLLAIVMFIFAVAGVNIFGPDAPLRFGSLPRAMYTLFIALTQDGWVQVFDELSAVGLYGAGTVFFFFFIFIGAFVFMNVISGVIVTNFQRAHEEFNEARQLKFRVLSGREGAAAAADNDEPKMIQTRPATRAELAGGGQGGQISLLPASARRVTLRAVEQYLFALTAIETNIEQFDALVAQLVSITERIQGFNQSLWCVFCVLVAVGAQNTCGAAWMSASRWSHPLPLPRSKPRLKQGEFIDPSIVMESFVL
jgi:cation channel sperm-associated protein 4